MNNQDIKISTPNIINSFPIDTEATTLNCNRKALQPHKYPLIIKRFGFILAFCYIISISYYNFIIVPNLKLIYRSTEEIKKYIKDKHYPMVIEKTKKLIELYPENTFIKVFSAKNYCKLVVFDHSFLLKGLKLLKGISFGKDDLVEMLNNLPEESKNVFRYFIGYNKSSRKYYVDFEKIKEYLGIFKDENDINDLISDLEN